MVKSNPEQEWKTAIHEAGHAIASLTIEDETQQDIETITIVEEGNTLGYISYTDKQDYEADMYDTEGTIISLKATIVTNYGGIIAETECLPESPPDEGHKSDIDSAKSCARIVYNAENDIFWDTDTDDNEHNQEKLKTQAKAAFATMNKCRIRCQQIIKENKTNLIRLARKLIQVKTMSGQEVKNFLASNEEPAIAPGEKLNTQEAAAPPPPAL